MAKTTSKKAASGKVPLSGPSSVPPELYRHPDPLIRRLRLLTSSGEPVKLASEFRDTTVVAFLFGEDWNPKTSAQVYSRTHELARVYPHRLKVVFVSLAESEEAHKRAAVGKAWLSMEWNDGCSCVPLRRNASFLD